MVNYEEQLAQEAALWGDVDEMNAVNTPPDWAVYRHLRHNAIMHTADIDTMLQLIEPGMTTLELGCGSGWLTLAMAQRGANATGLDISEKSLAIARDYAGSQSLAGAVHYEVADLNALDLPTNHYDVVVTKGTLHHLVEMRHVIATVHQALKPSGLFWISDQDGEESLTTALFASGLMFVLPTTLSYREKIGGLLKFGLRSPQRIKASMEAEGLSPFEGAGREHDWVKLINEHFTIEQHIVKPAVTGYLAHQVQLPDAIAMPLLRSIKAVDGILVKLKLLRSTGVILYARK